MRNQPIDSTEAGFTLIELIGVMLILAILIAIGMPALHGTRLANAQGAAEQAALGELNRARWMAINSGRPATQVALSGCTGVQCTVIQIVDPSGPTVLSSVDLSSYYVVAEGTNFPFNFDNRGFLATAGNVPSLQVSSTEVSASSVMTVSPLGKVQSP